TTLPVSPLAAPSRQRAVFPHFADGGGWTTQIALVNPTDGLLSGSIQFLGQGTANAAAQPVTLTVDGQTNSTFSYTIPPRSSRQFQTSGRAATTQLGSVRVTPEPSSKTPSGFGIFSFKSGGVTVSQSATPVSGVGSSFRLYAEASGIAGQ